jgi:glyoxylase-like metal-dependent hydrolase (beta-lactamase superfamily II)
VIEFHELITDIWLYRSEVDGHNAGVVVGERAVLLVDPGAGETDRRAVSRFLETYAQGRDARVVLFTCDPTGTDGWEGSHLMGRGVPKNGVSLPDLLPGWEGLTLGETGGGRWGVYNHKERVLFCGDMLVDPAAGIPRLVGDAQGYLDALTQLEGMDFKLAVPLRGPTVSGKRAIRARLEADRNYIHSLLRHVLTTQAANLPLERALDVAAEIYDTFPHLQDHLANMRSVWTELG